MSLINPHNGWAATDSSPMHWSGRKSEWDRKNNRVTLQGNAVFRQSGEILNADYMILDLNEHTVFAKGNCVYTTTDSIIYGREMFFHLQSRTGVIHHGRVSNEKFTLSGDLIDKLGPGHFKTENGEYTTCRDCPRSWSMQAGQVDIEFEGYAYMHDVTGKVKDSSIFWLPYLVVPVKTKRQTGLLFPKFSIMNGSFRYMQPFFWAISRSVDMTLSLGDYGDRGPRVEWEARYRLSSRSAGNANIYYLKDHVYQDYLSTPSNFPDPTVNVRPTPHRWAIDVSQVQELPFHIDEKIRLTELSDNLYPSRIGDVPGNGEAYVESEFSLSHSSDEVGAYVSAHRYRNLLDPNPQVFDPKMVQMYPAAEVTTNSKFLFGTPIAGNLTVGLKNFTRTAGPYDLDPWSGHTSPVDGVDPIREATRFSLNPSIYTTLRPWGLFSVIPAMEYRAFFYSFHQSQPDLRRGYLLFRVDLSAQIERIYDYPNDPDVPRAKHLIRPLLTYHLIPPGLVSQPSHPFLSQIDYARNGNATGSWSGYNFDDDDIIPFDNSGTTNNYFTPLGHSISYGFTTQYVRKKQKKGELPSYQTSVELKTGQTLNLLEFKKAQGLRQPFSQYFADLLFAYDNWSATTDYTYSPNVPITDTSSRHYVSTNFNYYIEKGYRQKILIFDRSFHIGYTFSQQNSATNNLQLGLNYSLSDYILPTSSWSYDFNAKRTLALMAALKFQSPSHCWTFDVGFNRSVCPKELPTDSGYCSGVTFNFSMNWTGTGMGQLSGPTTPPTDLTSPNPPPKDY